MGLPRFAHVANEWVHQEANYSLVWHLWWLVVAVLVPVLGLPALVVSLVVTVVAQWVPHLFSQSASSQVAGQPHLACVITGCDSGFGHLLVQQLICEAGGFTVFAACLRKESCAALEAEFSEAASEGRLHCLEVNVTSTESVDQMAKAVDVWLSQGPGNRRLHAVVNNAGIAAFGPIDWLDESSFRSNMEVNYFGVVRTVKALLPALKKAKATSPDSGYRPRLINVTSVAGLFATHFLGAYSASKHATEAFTATLRMELEIWGISVVTVTPARHRTNILAGWTALPDVWQNLDEAKKAEYGNGLGEHMAGLLSSDLAAKSWDPKHVTNTLEQAIKAVRPHAQYLVGLDARFIIPLIKMLPARVREPFLSFGSGIHSRRLPAEMLPSLKHKAP